MPLLIRGPGIPPGTVSGELVANIDLAPTLLDATGATADTPVDGRSLLPFARDPQRCARAARSCTRASCRATSTATARRAPTGSRATARSARARYLYVEWQGGARELYDRARDPGETHSRHADPRYRRMRRSLHRELQRLRGCAGDTCRQPVGPLR